MLLALAMVLIIGTAHATPVAVTTVHMPGVPLAPHTSPATAFATLGHHVLLPKAGGRLSTASYPLVTLAIASTVARATANATYPCPPLLPSPAAAAAQSCPSLRAAPLALSPPSSSPAACGDTPVPLAALCSAFRVSFFDRSAHLRFAITRHVISVQTPLEEWADHYARLVPLAPPRPPGWVRSAVDTVAAAWLSANAVVDSFALDYVARPLASTAVSVVSSTADFALDALQLSFAKPLFFSGFRACASGARFAARLLVAPFELAIRTLAGTVRASSDDVAATYASVAPDAPGVDTLLVSTFAPHASTVTVTLPLRPAMLTHSGTSIEVECYAPVADSVAANTTLATIALEVGPLVTWAAVTRELVAMTVYYVVQIAPFGPGLWLGLFPPLSAAALVGGFVVRDALTALGAGWAGGGAVVKAVVTAAACVAGAAAVAPAGVIRTVVPDRVARHIVRVGAVVWASPVMWALAGVMSGVPGTLLGRPALAVAAAVFSTGAVCFPLLAADHGAFAVYLAPVARAWAEGVVARVRRKAAPKGPRLTGVRLNMVERALTLSEARRAALAAFFCGRVVAIHSLTGWAVGCACACAVAFAVGLRQRDAWTSVGVAGGWVWGSLDRAAWQVYPRAALFWIVVPVWVYMIVGLVPFGVVATMRGAGRLGASLPRGWMAPLRYAGVRLGAYGPHVANGTLELAGLEASLYLIFVSVVWAVGGGEAPLVVQGVVWGAVGFCVCTCVWSVWLARKPRTVVEYYTWRAQVDVHALVGAAALGCEAALFGSVGMVPVPLLYGTVGMAATAWLECGILVVCGGVGACVACVVARVPSDVRLRMAVEERRSSAVVRVQVGREDFVRHSLLAVAAAGPEEVLGETRVQFVSNGVAEPGSDDGGLSQEWLSLLGPALAGVAVDEACGTIDPVLFCPAVRSGTADAPVYTFGGHDETWMYEMAGRLVARMFANRVGLGFELSPGVTRTMLGQRCVAGDLRVVDPELYTAKMAFAAHVDTASAELDIELRFVFDYHEPGGGALVTVPLRDGETVADAKVVSSDNYDEYMDAFAHAYLLAGSEEAAEAFARGVHAVVPAAAFADAFGRDERALARALLGDVALDVDEWERRSVNEVGAYAWAAFWGVVRALSAADQLRLFQAVTGHLHPPVGGLVALHPPMTVTEAVGAPIGALPTASVCSHTLRLPVDQGLDGLARGIAVFIETPFGFGRT